MGWIKNMRARQEERNRLFENLEINAKSLIYLIRVPPERSYGALSLTESQRTIYREFLEYLTALTEITMDLTVIETFCYRSRIREILDKSTSYNREIVKRIYGPDFHFKA